MREILFRSSAFIKAVLRRLFIKQVLIEAYPRVGEHLHQLPLDDAGRLTNLAQTHGLTTISDSAWAYNAKGQLTNFTGPDGSTDYTYDATGQLTGADSDYRSDESYSYDQSGNRTMAGYITDANNQLTSDGTYSYEYDGEGNRTRKTTIATGETVEYTWDHRNRLCSPRGRFSTCRPAL